MRAVWLSNRIQVQLVDCPTAVDRISAGADEVACLCNATDGKLVADTFWCGPLPLVPATNRPAS